MLTNVQALLSTQNHRFESPLAELHRSAENNTTNSNSSRENLVKARKILFFTPFGVSIYINSHSHELHDATGQNSRIELRVEWKQWARTRSNLKKHNMLITPFSHLHFSSAAFFLGNLDKMRAAARVKARAKSNEKFTRRWRSTDSNHPSLDEEVHWGGKLLFEANVQCVFIYSQSDSDCCRVSSAP